MNLINVLKIGVACAALVFSYWIGVQQGRESEELKNARLEIQVLKSTIQRYETKQKEQTIALAELRVSESAARADSDRMRDRIASLEKRTKTAQARDTVRCLELGAECRELLQQARGALNYCRKALQ